MSLAPWSSTLSLSPTELPTLAIVLGIVGGVLFVILLVTVICLLLLRCRSKPGGDQFASPSPSGVMTSPATCFDAQLPRPQRLVWLPAYGSLQSIDRIPSYSGGYGHGRLVPMMVSHTSEADDTSRRQRRQMAMTIPRPALVIPDSLASGRLASDETCVVSTH